MRAGVQIAEYVTAGLEGSIVPTAINVASVPPEILRFGGPYIPACQLMGSTLAQIGKDIPTTLVITASGALAGQDSKLLTAGVLDGMLSYRSSMRVTSDNAIAIAKRHGIRVEMRDNVDAGSIPPRST